MHGEIRERIVRIEDGRQAFRISPREAAEAIRRPTHHPERADPFGWRTRAWRADEFHWRLEVDLTGGGVDISASSGRALLDASRRGRPARRRPAGDLVGHRSLLDLLCPAHRRDLRYIRRAEPPGPHGGGPYHAGWPGGVAYVRRAGCRVGLGVGPGSRLRGRDFDALEVEEIHSDEPLGPEVFTSRRPLPWR